MRLVFSESAWQQYLYWQTSDTAVLERLNALIKQCKRTPFSGIGKPEPLKGELRGFWSRRLTHEDRLVYRVSGTGTAQQLEIAQCRFHY